MFRYSESGGIKRLGTTYEDLKRASSREEKYFGGCLGTTYEDLKQEQHDKVEQEQSLGTTYEDLKLSSMTEVPSMGRSLGTTYEDLKPRP